MSATIGNPKPLANELGIFGYEFIDFPHPTPKEYRPIYDLHIEKMTKKNIDINPMLLQMQSDSIVKFINSLDKTWRGIVLTTSNFKVKYLRSQISAKLPGRLFVPEEKQSLSDRIDSFKNNKDNGMIVVDTIQGWGSGISLDYDEARFSVIAGVPFPNPANKYESLRMERPGGKEYGFWVAYSCIPQAAGRVSRGEIDENGTPMLNVAALADGSCVSNMAMVNFPRWFKSSII